MVWAYWSDHTKELARWFFTKLQSLGMVSYFDRTDQLSRPWERTLEHCIDRSHGNSE
jgi:hypothetical protein